MNVHRPALLPLLLLLAGAFQAGTAPAALLVELKGWNVRGVSAPVSAER